MKDLRKYNSAARILIIEDDKEMRSLLEDILDEEGFETESVSNGSDGLQKLIQEPFDLVITDIRMPGLTGLDILPVIKRLQPNASVIVITAFGNEEVYRRSFEKGATGYLEKPIHMDQLKTLVHEMVSSKGRIDKGLDDNEDKVTFVKDDSNLGQCQNLNERR
jgi:two-component system response regulator (stage 0 sporulation protein F)